MKNLSIDYDIQLYFQLYFPFVEIIINDPICAFQIIHRKIVVAQYKLIDDIHFKLYSPLVTFDSVSGSIYYRQICCLVCALNGGRIINQLCTRARDLWMIRRDGIELMELFVEFRFVE